MTDAPLPAFIDLRTLADQLVGREEYRRLRSELDRAARAQSCAADLQLAEAQCQALSDLLQSSRKRGTVTRQATEGALLQMAVILYERATSAAGKRGERGSVSVIDHLTASQRQDHESLVRVRHRALAHVYPNEAIDGQVWQHDLMLAVEHGPLWQPVSATRRVQFNRDTHERLSSQLPVMKALLKGRYQAALANAMELLNANPLPQSFYNQHRIDPIATFGSRRNVEAVLEGRPFGEVSFIEHHGRQDG